MAFPAIVGAVLRIDLRGFLGDPPAALGAPLRDAAGPDGSRSLYYDLGGQIDGLTPAEACGRLALRLDRLFLAPESSPFADAAARRMRLDLGLIMPDPAAHFSHDLPAGLLDCLGQMEAELGLTYYPAADDANGVVEDV